MKELLDFAFLVFKIPAFTSLFITHTTVLLTSLLRA